MVGGDELEHRLGEVQAPDFGGGVALGEDAGEAALAAADVEDAAARQVAEEFEDELDVVDAGIDGGGEVLLVARGFLEGSADAAAQIRRQLGLATCAGNSLSKNTFRRGSGRWADPALLA